jgi:hypothetical protein
MAFLPKNCFEKLLINQVLSEKSGKLLTNVHSTWVLSLVEKEGFGFFSKEH